MLMQSINIEQKKTQPLRLTKNLVLSKPSLRMWLPELAVIRPLQLQTLFCLSHIPLHPPKPRCQLLTTMLAFELHHSRLTLGLLAPNLSPCLQARQQLRGSFTCSHLKRPYPLLLSSHYLRQLALNPSGLLAQWPTVCLIQTLKTLD